jgi:CBS domain-containing protein
MNPRASCSVKVAPGKEDAMEEARFEEVRAGDVMHPGVVFCLPQASLATVARIMAERRVHSVVVSDLDTPVSKRNWGVVSDVDLLRAAAEGIEGQTAGQVAKTELRTIAVDETLPQAARIMAEHGVTHLIVVDADGSRAVGVLSSLDLAMALATGNA